MTQESTGTASAQGGAGKNDLIERARKAAGEWHRVPEYALALRFLPPGASGGGERFEIRGVSTEPPENEYKQYLYTSGRHDLAVSRGGAVWHCDLSASELPASAGALAEAVKHSLRSRPPARGWWWGYFVNAFDWLAPDLFGPHPELSGWRRFAYAFAGSATFFGILTLIMQVRYNDFLGFDGAGPGDESPFTARVNVFAICFFLLTSFFAFICSRNKHAHSPLRVYIFAYLIPLIVWILASQIGVSGLLFPLPGNGGGP